MILTRTPAVYRDIAPYTSSEIIEALDWLKNSSQFIQGVQYIHPSWTKEGIVKKLENCKSCADFQVAFIEPMISDLIKHSISELRFEGFDNIKKGAAYLFISNHRDIFLDAGLLQYELYHNGHPFTEISLGNNLIVNEVMERVAKLNSMYTVVRYGSKSELINNAKVLSAYLQHAISEKKVSAWIAQGNGRTKDGNDKTFPGLINMLLLGEQDIKEKLHRLPIMISTVSYEYEPCDVEKAKELQTIEDTGHYEKTKYENINSIVHGIQDYKGKVHLCYEQLSLEGIDFNLPKKKIIQLLAERIDAIMHKNYKLFPTNYLAADLLSGKQKYADHYTLEDKERFLKHLEQAPQASKIQTRLLAIYATPVENRIQQ
ncbi:MAG: hypothetical protein OIF50_03555 [Flavobacteriaceae bacterium]|nr:hypothetical protein [Flavobacteriaceae bacterium]